MTTSIAELVAALDAERAWCLDAHRRSLDLPPADRVAAGVSWTPVRATAWAPDPDGGRLDLTPNHGALHDAIRAGDLVRVAPLSDPDRGPVGRVLDADPDGATVALDVDDPEPPLGPLLVTRQVDTLTFDRYRAALLRAEGHRSLLRDALLAGRPTPPRPHDPPPPPLALEGAQAAAATAALASPALSWIHGPPGTGKTTVIVAMVRALTPYERPWVLADSNAAVDHLTRTLVAAGVRVLRPGAAPRIAADVTPWTLPAALASGPYAAALAALERDLSRARGPERRPLAAELRRVRALARLAAFEAAQAVVTTLGTLAGLTRSGGLPPARTAIVDEATQAIEPAIWTVVPHVERLILVGDPHQLGPVVQQPGNPLGRSLLERLLTHGAAPRLDVQHRMHGAVMGVVADVYPGLVAAPEVVSARLCDLPGVARTSLTERPVVWIDTAGLGAEHERDPATGSWHNPTEAQLVVAAVQQLRAAGVSPHQIAVATPYTAQVVRLRSLLPDVRVASINAWQGQEADAVVVSWVRSDPAGDVGFVADRRRWVVAITRARRLLVLVGDTATLDRPPIGGLVQAAAGVPGAWESPWSPPWSDALP